MDAVGARYDRVVAALIDMPGVTRPVKRGFGAGCLKIDDKMFVSLTRGGHLLLKLPVPRIDWLVDAGEGERFEPMAGRIMKEWIVMRDDSETDWLALAREAMTFVASEAKAVKPRQKR